MSNKTRKALWPVALVLAVVAIGAMALAMGFAGGYGTAQAHGPGDGHNADSCAGLIDAPVHDQLGDPDCLAAPTGVDGTATMDSITLMWDAVTGAESYIVEYKTGSNAYGNAMTPTATTTPVTGLAADTEYTFRVRATSAAAGEGRWSADAMFSTLANDNQEPVLTGTPLADVSLRIPERSESIDASVAFSDPDEGDVLTYSADSSNTGVATVSIDPDSGMLVIMTGPDAFRGITTITVTATDDDGASVTITFEVRVSEGYTLTAVPVRDAANRSTYVVEELGEYTAKFSVMVGGSNDDVTVTITARVPAAGGITVTDSNGLLGAGFNQEDDLEGSLTIKKEDDGDSRAFEIEGACVTEGAMVSITVQDDDLDQVAVGYILCKEQPATVTKTDDTSSDLFTVASYGDEEFDKVTDGFILDVSNGNDHMVNDDLNETGLLRRDEPVIHTAYTLGVSSEETLEDMANGSPRRVKTGANMTRQEKNADVEAGQRTIEVLAGQPNVQLTVTSKMAGPVYIRFLDSQNPPQPFGTDVDEEPMWRGADVVGLDSQGRLALNNRVALSAAKALAYDQYSIKTPDIIEGQAIMNSKLVGVASAMDADGNYVKDYYQGTFRFFNPCPSVGHHFYVQVYESTGKDLETTEKVMCVDSPRPGPTGLEFTVDSQEAGRGELTYRHALNADSHTVLLVDAHSRTIVTGGEITDATETVRFGAGSVGPTLNDGWRYHFIVVAHGVNDQYTADAITVTTEWINNPDAAASTLTAGTPTRTHIVCQTDNVEVKALLADCDADPVSTEMTAPTGVAATADGNAVTVTWVDGENADSHGVILFDSNWEFGTRIAGQQTDGTVTFENVPAGDYTAVVVASDTAFTEMKIGADTVTVQ